MKQNSLLLWMLGVSIVAIGTAHPFLFFPSELLPCSGVTWNLTFNGFFDTIPISGIYAVQTVTNTSTKTIIGYRNWQTYNSGLDEIFYGVSYLNGTYLQALIDRNNHQCFNVFSELMNCTEWLQTQENEWESRCSIVRIDSPIRGEMMNFLRASNTNPKRPISYVGTVTIDGSSQNTSVSFDFQSFDEADEKLTRKYSSLRPKTHQSFQVSDKQSVEKKKSDPGSTQVTIRPVETIRLKDDATKTLGGNEDISKKESFTKTKPTRTLSSVPPSVQPMNEEKTMQSAASEWPSTSKTEAFDEKQISKIFSDALGENDTLKTKKFSPNHGQDVSKKAPTKSQLVLKNVRKMIEDQSILIGITSINSMLPVESVQL